MHIPLHEKTLELCQELHASNGRLETEESLQKLHDYFSLHKERFTHFLFHSGKEMLSYASHKKSRLIRSVSTALLRDTFSSMSGIGQLHFIVRHVINPDDSAGLSEQAKWQTHVVCLQLLSDMAAQHPELVESLLTTLIPLLTSYIWHTKVQVREQARTTMADVANTISNEDIIPFIPSLIDAIVDPEHVKDCIYALAGTTFVTTVKASALALTVPVLERGFKERNTVIQRKCAVITENLAKLVTDPNDVVPFVRVLSPALEKGLKDISDPECRERFTKANSSLQAVIDKIKTHTNAFEHINECSAFTRDVLNVIDLFRIQISAKDLKSYMHNEENENLIEDIQKIILSFSSNCSRNPDTLEHSDDDICNIDFSLAYGTNILLNNARLHIVRGAKYGIIANKSAGKTTLLRSIANGQIEGFPSANEVRTVFIENDIQGEQQTMNVVQYVQDTVNLEHHPCDISEENITSMLKDIGFTQDMINGPITSLSGGWKMKLALGRATLQKADIMLMDEPTNHLDVINVQWVVDYINSISNVTCLIVSHDTAFLDKTVQYVIHFKDLKLNTYAGNVSEFMSQVPEARSYFELGSTSLTFAFPIPTPLGTGSKSNKGRTLLQMKNVSFTYPGANKAQLNDVNVKASMASRVAIVGANGAGKSTLIKLLTGELKPSSGEVKQHPNCRFAYVAQHAFHHIEQHLDKSPNKYICWRYQSGEDKEADNKATLEVSEEEEAEMKKPWNVAVKDTNGDTRREKRIVEKLLSRRKSKKTYEYEVRWKNKSMDENMWFSRDLLIKKGFLKLLNALDSRLAAVESMNHRPLTQKNVSDHLAAVGLETEFSNHSRIRDLSGGQKVKVVLAACTWACPHLIILDEPTNYLDRDSLGALANAINDFEGGVVLITHNKEFAELTTRETWVVSNHRCDVKGDPEWEKYAAEQQVIKENTGTTDAYGNKIEANAKPKKIKDMSRKEIKQNKKKLKEKLKTGEELETFELEWASEWNLL